MVRRKLPIGIQTFRELREGDFYYVDKTAFMHRLATDGKHYVLSRPRYFGKSLFLDTLKELFEGNESLFEGLYVHDHRDWSVRHPVLRLDFSFGHYTGPEDLEAYVSEQLAAAESRIGLRAEHQAVTDRFAALLEALHEYAGQRVTVLIDAYDKPILDAMNSPEIARANRNCLHKLFAVLGSSEERLEFTFLTGVSKCSKVGLFSGLDRFEDITLDPRYSAICGFTDSELDAVFAPEFSGLDRDAVRDWYNGYDWLGDEKVCNPCDILLSFHNRKLGAWWFDTGRPTSLVQTLCRRRIPSVSLEGMLCNHDLLSALDVGHIGTEALLFQGGYLTITGKADLGGGTLYRLGYPNRALRQRLNEHMLDYLVKDGRRHMSNRVRLYRMLEANDLAGLEKLFRAFFTGIPRKWYAHHDSAGFEGYCASVFYSYFASLGLHVAVEDSTSRGRLDMAVVFNDNVYLFEFKVVELAGEGTAMARLRGRGYADKYRYINRPVHLVAVEFSKETRTVVAFETARAGP